MGPDLLLTLHPVIRLDISTRFFLFEKLMYHAMSQH